MIELMMHERSWKASLPQLNPLMPRLLQASVPNRVAYREAATRRIPVHIHERTRRDNASAKQIMETLRNEIFGILSKPNRRGIVDAI